MFRKSVRLRKVCRMLILFSLTQGNDICKRFCRKIHVFWRQADELCQKNSVFVHRIATHCRSANVHLYGLLTIFLPLPYPPHGQIFVKGRPRNPALLKDFFDVQRAALPLGYKLAKVIGELGAWSTKTTSLPVKSRSFSRVSSRGIFNTMISAPLSFVMNRH